MRARLRLLIPATAAIATAIACAVPSANAGLLDPITRLLLPTCATASQVFAPVDNDRSSYYGFSNNGFESGANGWSLSGGAYVTGGNEPWYVNGPGSRSLALPAGASATSPAFCISLLDPSGRMFAHAAGATGNLQVQVIFRGLTGNLTGLLNVASMSPGGYASWSPSSRFNSLLALPLGTSSAQIRITSTARAGTWQVDDVFVDPMLGRLG